MEKSEVDLTQVGGLKTQIRAIKQTIVYPLLYPDLFERNNLSTDRGILFHGPPGTGKTLLAAAIVNECRKLGIVISLFVRKGSDFLSSYFGQSEKNLRDLFSMAQKKKPAIIFFDEIDGMARSRSPTQDQSFSSTVGTLLALMDGLDSKSGVFVIGATNRIDMLDPALRRPGRFDKELFFPLPDLEARLEILRIITDKWETNPNFDVLVNLASSCSGFCGADLQYMCRMAMVECLERVYPSIQNINRRLRVDCSSLQVEPNDFWKVKNKIIPASQRTHVFYSCPLSQELAPLLSRNLKKVLEFITEKCPYQFLYPGRSDYLKSKVLKCPRLLILHPDNELLSRIGAAVLYQFDTLPVTMLDSSEYTHNIGVKIETSKNTMPGILYLKNMNGWWDQLELGTKHSIRNKFEELDLSEFTQLFILATATFSCYNELPDEIQEIFPKNSSIVLETISCKERENYFNNLIIEKTLVPPVIVKELSPVSSEEFRPETEIGEQRRSLRLMGQPPDYDGYSFDNIPSYIIRLNHRTSITPRSVSKRRRNIFDNFSNCKMPKLEEPCCQSKHKSRNYESSMSSSKSPDLNKIKNEVVTVDGEKLKKLVMKAVDITGYGHLRSLLNLYENLAATLVRYTNVSDRTNIVEDYKEVLDKFETEMKESQN